MNTSAASQTTTHHQDIFELLPWYACDSLGDADRARVDAHLESCVTCMSELADLANLREELEPVSFEEEAIEHSLSKMNAILDHEAPHPRTERQSLWSRILEGWQEASAGMRFAVGGQAFAIALAMIWFVSGNAGQSPQGYETLSSADGGPQTKTIRIRPGDDVSEQDFRDLLLQEHLQIVSGPTELGLYTVRSTERVSNLASLIQRLEESPLILIASETTEPRP